MVRVADVGDRGIDVRAVSFTVGKRTYGPFANLYSAPARIAAGCALVVEALLSSADSDDLWPMLEGIAHAANLGRPVIAASDANAPYGSELDGATRRANGQVVRGFRDLSSRKQRYCSVRA